AARRSSAAPWAARTSCACPRRRRGSRRAGERSCGDPGWNGGILTSGALRCRLHLRLLPHDPRRDRLPPSFRRHHRGRRMSLTRQGRHYLFIGGVQWLVDWGVMVALSHFGMAVGPANVVGRIAGALLGYWANGKLTFAGE